MSTYIIDQNPNKYGGKQLEYIERTQVIVNECVERFKRAVEDKYDLISLFHEILDYLGTQRQKIATDHQTKNAELFGRRRDKELFPGPCSITPLAKPYIAYNERLIPFIQQHLRKVAYTLREFPHTDLEVLSAACLGRKSKLTFSILPFQAQNKWAILFTHEEVTRIANICSLPSPENDKDEILKFHEDLIKNREALFQLKQKSPDDYKRIKVSLGITTMRTWRKEEKKSDWVLVTERFEVDGKMYAFSQYITWMYRTFKDDPVERMQNCSLVGIIHQDVFLIEPMLNDIAKVFKEVIEADKNNIQLLKERIALLQYELAHCMPFVRGSAAISEWMEMALYQHHGYRLEYNKDKMVNLEALTLRPHEFISQYETMINLHSLEKSNEN